MKTRVRAAGLLAIALAAWPALVAGIAFVGQAIRHGVGSRSERGHPGSRHQ